MSKVLAIVAGLKAILIAASFAVARGDMLSVIVISVVVCFAVWFVNFSTFSGRSGIYDVQVTVGDTVIAEFRGHSRVIPGTWLPETDTKQK